MRTLFVLLLAVFSTALAAQSTSRDYSVDLTATVQASPAQITLNWTTAIDADIYRRDWGSTNWGSAFASVTNATTWTDTSVSTGQVYEYAVGSTNLAWSAWGVITAGIDVPATEERGKLVLIVDDTHATALAVELARLEDDLAGDGWQVLRHDVSPTYTVPSVKALITGDYNADPTNVKAVLLFGDIPVPYSGNLNPDGHPDHEGAWPADCYYGEMNGTWTDTSVNNTVASRTQNDNVPGDGKFDQTAIPGTVELMVGRVDLSDMGTFSQTEQELLKAYLDKNHEFRTAQWRPQDRAVVDDNFGTFSGEAFAASGWRSFSPMCGPSNVNTGDFITDTSAGDYLWAYGCGGGSYTSASGIGNTASFANNAVQVAFTVVFGSYHGDWDSTNNFLRAPLASGKALTSAWSGRPWWYFHSMAIGEPIGMSYLETVNDPVLGSYGNQWVHIALMGDPTLRLHYVAPATSAGAAHTAGNPVDVTWTASTDTVTGYYVYRADSKGGPYTRLTTSPVTGTSYSDIPSDGTYWYMVRALATQNTPSGSYENLATGAFAQVTVSGGTGSGGTGGGSSGGGGGDDDGGGCAIDASTGLAWFMLLLMSAAAALRFRRRIGFASN